MKDISTFLMFAGDQHGRAKEAIDLYVSLFPDSRIERLDLHGPGEHGPEGTVRTARFILNGRPFMAIDSAIPHAFTFTPSTSLFVDCESAEEVDRLYAALSAGGQVLMPLDDYGFSPRFGWVNDRFGVSWQLNLTA